MYVAGRQADHASEAAESSLDKVKAGIAPSAAGRLFAGDQHVAPFDDHAKSRRLDPRHERPEFRTFATNPVQEATANRGRLVTAALTVLIVTSSPGWTMITVRDFFSALSSVWKLMSWAPSIRLEDGMERTYKWIHDEMASGKDSVVNALPRAVAAQ